MHPVKLAELSEQAPAAVRRAPGSAGPRHTARAARIAVLCAADNAHEHPDPLVRAIATRVAFNPYPLDPFPWAPRWGPATKDIDDHVTVPHGLGMHYELRRWWNFNGPMIRPEAFPAGSAADTHHRELLKPYRLPLETRPGMPRHVNHLYLGTT